MAVTAAPRVPLERVAAGARDGDLTEEDRAALWLYEHLIGARHRPATPAPRRRFETVYDESGYPVRSARR
jgi:hypothetical protein